MNTRNHNIKPIELVRFAKGIVRPLIPNSVRRWASLYRYWLRFGLKEEKNLELKDKHLGHRAFIIGNGPSILKQDLTQISGEVTFVLNSFFHHPQYEQINPTYLCNCDPDTNDIRYRQKWYELQKYKTKNTIKLFSKSSEVIDKSNGFFEDHSVYYLHTSVPFLPPLSSLNYCPSDLTKPLSGHGLTFIDIALLSAYYMGIKEVYLLGMDGGSINSLEDYMNYNFYGPDPLYSLEEYIAFYDAYFVDERFQISRQGLYEKSISCIERTFSKTDVKVFNATLQGDDIGFERIKFEDIFK